jgi:hypothetical protein
MGVNWTDNFNPLTPAQHRRSSACYGAINTTSITAKLGINPATAAAGLVPASVQAGQAARDQRSGHCISNQLHFKPPDKAVILSDALRGFIANRELYGAESEEPVPSVAEGTPAVLASRCSWRLSGRSSCCSGESL